MEKYQIAIQEASAGCYFWQAFAVSSTTTRRIGEGDAPTLEAAMLAVKVTWDADKALMKAEYALEGEVLAKDFSEADLQLLRTGQDILFIKGIREKTGASLQDAMRTMVRVRAYIRFLGK